MRADSFLQSTHTRSDCSSASLACWLGRPSQLRNGGSPPLVTLATRKKCCLWARGQRSSLNHLSSQQTSPKHRRKKQSGSNTKTSHQPGIISISSRFNVWSGSKAPLVQGNAQKLDVLEEKLPFRREWQRLSRGGALLPFCQASVNALIFPSFYTLFVSSADLCRRLYFLFQTTSLLFCCAEVEMSPG